MIRGAIEVVTNSDVTGWLFSDLTPVAGKTILAFVDGECVGASSVDIHRPDLQAAGLGDGMFGFKIGISLNQPGDEMSLVVRLDGSDLALMQPHSLVTRADALIGLSVPSFRTPGSVEWMRQRGWLEQSDIDLLKSLGTFGLYDRSLRVTKSTPKPLEPMLGNPPTVITEIFELLRLGSVAIAEHAFGSVADLCQAQQRLMRETQEPVVAILASAQDTIRVVEGSHQDAPTAEQDLRGAVDHTLAPDRLLLLDLRCRFGPAEDSSATTLRVFSLAALEQNTPGDHRDAIRVASVDRV